MEKMNKKQAGERIDSFFEKRHDKEEVRKIKRLAMAHRIKLGDERKKFCKKCFSMNLRVKKVKGDRKTVECSECGNIMRWKV